MKLINLHRAYNTMNKIIVPALSYRYSKYEGTIDYCLEGDFAKYVALKGKRKKQLLACIDLADLFSGDLSEIEIAVNKTDLTKAVQRIDALFGSRLSRGSRSIESKQNEFILSPGKWEFLLPIKLTPRKWDRLHKMFYLSDICDWFYP